jgi:hypothetical protein
MKLVDKMNSKPKRAKKSSSKQINLTVHMPEVTQLIRHLDVLYTDMVRTSLLAKIRELRHPQQPMSEILGQPFVQTRSWFNPGQGIKQSAAVE